MREEEKVRHQSKKNKKKTQPQMELCLHLHYCNGSCFIRSPLYGVSLQLSYVSCLRTAVTFSDVEFNFLTFVKSLEAVALNCGEMYEYVLAAFILNKTVTLFCVKPFNCTFQMNNLLKIPPSMANIYIITHVQKQCNPFLAQTQNMMLFICF